MKNCYYYNMNKQKSASVFTWSFLKSGTIGQRANRKAESMGSVARQSNSDMKEEIEGNPEPWTTGPPCAQGAFYVYV